MLLALWACSASAQRLHLVPRLHAGQSLIYRLDFTGSRTTKTDSRVTSAPAPTSADTQASCLLLVDVVEATGSVLRLRTSLSDRPPAASSLSLPAKPAVEEAADKTVEVQIAADGGSLNIKGFDQLSVAQQFAWNAWLGRFTSSLTFPDSGIRPGQKWQLTEPETAPSPIAKLIWLKKYQYVRDEPCVPGDATSAESCAVVLVKAHLHQDSSPGHATPEEFRRRGLSTNGAATGTNETILYISKDTGLLVRSTEDAQQSMDVIIALADGANGVHYSITAKSRSQVQLLRETPQDVR